MRRSTRSDICRRQLVGALAVLAGALGAVAQQPPPAGKSEADPPEVEKLKKLLGTGGIDRRPKAAPDTFLPPGNRRTSEPGVVRAYKNGPDGERLEGQPDGYPKTVDPDTFKAAADESIRVHEGADYSSRDAKGVVRPLDFKSGVYGKVVEVGGHNALGRIAVEVDERGNRVEYLHTSETHVKVGDQVNPDTTLGKTGGRGAGGRVHLHVQARNKGRQAISPDEVVTYAKAPPAERKPAEFFVPMTWRPGLLPATVDFDLLERARVEAREAEELRKRLDAEFNKPGR